MKDGVEMVNGLSRIVGKADAKAAVAVEKTASDIQAGCMERSRVDTGQMKSGWLVESHGLLEAEVGNSVEHAIYNEFGTDSRLEEGADGELEPVGGMSPQPMLTPSVEEAREPFDRAIAQAYQ